MARNAAFEILYREYYVRVFGLCRRLLNSSDQAEDATQEAFMRAYRNFSKYDAQAPFWHWIAAIANHHCIDLLRRRARSEQLFGDEAVEFAQLGDTDTPLLSGLMTMEKAQHLNNAVAALPDKYRVPVVLAYFNQSSYDEIAHQLQISRSHVGVLLLRARQRLRAALADGDEGHAA